MPSLRIPVLLLLAPLAVLVGVRPASADLGSHFGMNPRSMGLGGAYAAVADDMAALYYNPAGLVQLQGMSAAAGVLYGLPRLNEDGTRLPMPDERSYYLHVGVPLAGKLKDHLALGALIHLPFGKHLTTTLYKKHEPFFVLYDAAVQILQIRIGGALRIPWKPLDFLSVGFALQILGSVLGDMGFYAPFQRGTAEGAADPDSRLEAWAKIEVPTATFVTVGAMAFLAERWRAGVTFRQEQYIDIELPIYFNTRLAISETSRINIPVSGVAAYKPKYHPHQVTAGVSYEGDRLLLTGDLTWVNYSSFAAPFPTVTLDIENLKKDPGLSLLLGKDSMLLDPFQPHVRWKDVLVPRVGAEYRLLDWLVARAGYFYERSPLEATDLPIYDCDKHGLAVGVGFRFLRPWGLIPGWLNFDLGIQELIYAPRKVMGSDVGGHVFAVSTGLEIIFL